MFDKIRAEKKETVELRLRRTVEVIQDIYAGRIIFELLQNAEDAIGKKHRPKKLGTVHFKLTDDALSFSHYGKPFDKNDVDSICDVDLSTKVESKGTIGKFGLGFQSVYNFTETPQISSGSCHFEIKDRFYPHEIRDPDEISSLNGGDSEKTTIRLPFKIDLPDATASIGKDFTKLDGQTILFLRHITKIEWQIPDGIGFLERTDTNEDTNVRSVNVRSVTVNSSSQDEAEHWLIFDRDVASPDGSKVTSLKIAFHQSKTDGGDWSITKIDRDLCLSVYFPTREETHLSFHVQGEFETTKTRENILEDSEWNKRLVKETGELLVVALLWLKQKKKLNEGVLECLPIEDNFFPDIYGDRQSDRLFAPVAKRLVKALREKELLPTTNNGYCKASDAVYPSTPELAQLFNVAQLESLFKQPNIRWLSIQGCQPLEGYYLKNRLEILEISTKDIIDCLDEDFLEKQKDSWIKKFYAFLLDELYSFDDIKKKPILRLQNGRHVCYSSTVCLPPKQGETKYDCVKRELLKGDNGKKARKFVKELGIVEPDLVLEALKRVKYYNCQRKRPSITKYKKDLKTILDATKSEATDERKDELYKALKDANIVLVDTADGKSFEKPNQVYLPTDELKTLIGDKEGTLFADKTIIKKEMHDWMKRCGVHDHLRIEEYQDDNRWDELYDMIEPKPTYTRGSGYTDYIIPELDHIFCKIRTAELEKKHALSKELWDQMENVKAECWQATLRWLYYSEQEKSLSSKIKQQLNDTAWILDPHDGNLKKPSEIFFPQKWGKHNYPFKNIEFRKSEVVEYFMSEDASEEVARELSEKYLTLADAKEYVTRGKNDFFSKDAEEHRAAKEKPAEEKPIEIPENSNPIDTPHISDPRHQRPNRNGEPTQSSWPSTRSAESTASRRRTSSSGSKPTIVIESGNIAPNRKTEDAAINFVLKEDLDLIDANEDNPNNPGYDLHNKKKDKFIEVKGVSGEFTWVSMTITQFKCAMEKGDQYWLYVVEYAESDEPKLYRLHDLARSLAEANVIIKKDGLDWQK